MARLTPHECLDHIELAVRELAEAVSDEGIWVPVSIDPNNPRVNSWEIGKRDTGRRPKTWRAGDLALDRIQRLRAHIDKE